MQNITVDEFIHRAGDKDCRPEPSDLQLIFQQVDKNVTIVSSAGQWSKDDEGATEIVLLYAGRNKFYQTDNIPVGKCCV